VPTDLLRALLGSLEDELPRATALRERLHASPEPSHEERLTAGLVAEDLGTESIEPLAGTGLVARVGPPGETVVVRAELDALPIREETDAPFAAANGFMHACGHDVHVACLAGAAQLLADGREHWTGTLVALFQPAEETGDGARGMVDAGLGTLVPTPEVALAQHVMPLPAGRVGTHAGAALSAADSMRITVHGRGAHGSMPQAAVDPVVLAAMIVVRLQTVVSREVPPGETAVLTVGSVQAGTKSNVIPDSAVLQLNVRTFSDATRSTILAAIERIVRAECRASGCPREPEFEPFDRFPLTENDPATTDRVAAAFGSFFGDGFAPVGQQSASEDFSDIPGALGVPYTYWFVGGIDAKTYDAAAAAGRIAQDVPVNHSADFAPVLQPTLDTGTRALVVGALAWLAA
jgi:hippurate hydrolase